jgi:thiol-disulfide isomerase/thioredoxin
MNDITPQPLALPLGKLSPDFTLNDLAGNPHRLHTYQGRVVILNFWSAECPFVERVDRLLLPLMTNWGERVALLPIASNANEPLDLLARIAVQRGIPTVLHDPAQRVADLYRAVTTPHFFVLDSRGILRYEGAFDDVTFRQRTPTRDYLRQAIEALLSGSLPDPVQTSPYGCALVRFPA